LRSFPITFNGANGQTYEVLTSTSLSLPLSGWTQISTGTTAINQTQFYRVVSP
jgi:hypothetical protein